MVVGKKKEEKTVVFTNGIHEDVPTCTVLMKMFCHIQGAHTCILVLHWRLIKDSYPFHVLLSQSWW